MPKLSKTQCDNLVFRYFLAEGWLPPGTTAKTWRAVTMGEMRFDDPPLPSSPDLQKSRIALDLQHTFFLLGSSLPDPTAQLKDGSLVLRDFAAWCFDQQVSQ